MVYALNSEHLIEDTVGIFLSLCLIPERVIDNTKHKCTPE